MATATLQRVGKFGLESNGTLMTPREFDRAEFVEGWRYELIHGVLVVSSTPLESERDPNGELEYLLRLHRDTHPRGNIMSGTLPEQVIRTRDNRRRADRVIWAGLGRKPRRGEMPTIVVEFVSSGKRDRLRDYEEKRDEYLEIGIREYWIFDRFKRTLTVYSQSDGKRQKKIVREKQIYTTDLLPGFDLPVGRLLAVADSWDEEAE